MSLWRARLDFVCAVMEMIVTSKRLIAGRMRLEFLGFPGVAEDEDAVAVIDDAEVTVQGVHGVQQHTGGARAGERGGDLVATLPDLPTPVTTTLLWCGALDDRLDALEKLLSRRARVGASGRSQYRRQFLQA